MRATMVAKLAGIYCCEKFWQPFINENLHREEKFQALGRFALMMGTRDVRILVCRPHLGGKL